MMTSSRKKIYIAVLILIVAIAAIVLFFNRSSIPAPPVSLTLPGSQPAAKGSADTAPASPSSPSSLFPNSTQFDLSVLDSAGFKMLKAYPPLSVGSNDLGRDDPFKPY